MSATERSHLIGLDLGGTKLAAAAVVDGRVVDRYLHATEKDSTDALVDQMVSAIEDVREADTDAVGIGIPSVIDFATGAVRHSVNIPLEGVPLRQLLEQRIGLPVFVDNDANCAALAEAHDDGRLAVHELVMITVGTGVGGGLVLGGRLYRGATGAGAELGHTIIGADLRDGAPKHASHFPQAGSLEALAAGTALDHLAEEAAAENPHSALGRLAAGGKAVRGPDCVEAARAGDAVAVAAVRLLGERLGVGIANAINIFDPEVVAVGGGASRAGEMLLEPARATAQRFVLPGVGTRTEIRLARAGVEAGVLGAALMAGQESSHAKAAPLSAETG